MPTCLLVRHGRTDANASGVLAGWTPGVRLDDVGRSQTEALAGRIVAAGVHLSAVVVSPLERCRQTAEVLLAGVGPELAPDGPVRVDDRWGECRYGSWTGRRLAELAAEPLWRVVQDQPSAARFPDGTDYVGESIAQMQARALAAVRETDEAVAAAYGPEAVWLVVSHGDVIKAVLADAAGAHLDHFQRLRVDPASVSVVHYTSRRPFVVRSNDTGGDLAAVVSRATPTSADAVPGGGGGAPSQAEVAGDDRPADPDRPTADGGGQAG